MNLALDADTQTKLLAYITLLYKWNKTFSLTAMKEEDKAVSHHLLDSLAILPYVPPGNLLDVGSGGGTPGIPLAIARPDLEVTLADSNSKKTAFLQQAAIELKLKNLKVHTGRIEQYKPPKLFSAITSRAFAEVADFIKLSRHLLADNGCWLAMKGVWPHDEIAKLPTDIVVEHIYPLSVPGVEGERHLVLLKDHATGFSGEHN